ncbi:MAG: radical SAM/SPASM domain-containing protein [Candidatus Brocadiia bacterium]
MAHKDRQAGVGRLFRAAVRLWGLSAPRRLPFFLRVAWRLWRAERRRRRAQRRLGCPVPSVVAVSPTMRCTYACGGCYSRGRPTEDELSTEELDYLLAEAEELGVLAVVVTGGEPLLRPDLLDLCARHRRLLFVLITNGLLVTAQVARRLARSGNAVTLVSAEGGPAATDRRRRPGAHAAALRAFARLHEAGACFGFAAMATAENAGQVADDEFIGQMRRAGCSVGYITEYVPCGPAARTRWVLDATTRARLRQRVLELREREPMVLIQLPHDEYGPANRCLAAGRASLHVNAQGDVEPCPFVPLARHNVRQGGLVAACRCSFLRAIREHPTLLQRERYACALFEHREELLAVARQQGARPTA